MRKTVLGLFAVFLIAMVAASVNAQSMIYPLKVNVPFDFIVGDAHLPQGQYTVSTLNTTYGAVELRGQEDSSIVLTSPTDKRVGGNGDQLVFHRVNGEYFLASIWTADNPEGCAIAISRHERELIAQGARPESEVLVASIR